MKKFLKSTFGKKIETALWQIAVLIIGLLISYAGDMNVAWLLPFIPVMNAITKYINVTYIK